MEISTYSSEGKWIKPWEGRHVEFSDFDKRALDEMELPYPPWTIRNNGVLWDKRCAREGCERFAYFGWKSCIWHCRKTYTLIRYVYFKVAYGILFNGSVLLRKFEREIEDKKSSDEITHYDYLVIMKSVYDCQDICEKFGGVEDFHRLISKHFRLRHNHDDVMESTDQIVTFYLDSLSGRYGIDSLNAKLKEITEMFLWASNYVEGFSG